VIRFRLCVAIEPSRWGKHKLRLAA